MDVELIDAEATDGEPIDVVQTYAGPTDVELSGTELTGAGNGKLYMRSLYNGRVIQ